MAVVPPQTGTLGWCLLIRTHHGDIHLFQSQRPSQKPNRFPWFKVCPSQGPRPVWSFYSQISGPPGPGPPRQYPRVTGRGQSCHSHRVHPRTDMCVSMGAAQPGLGGEAGVAHLFPGQPYRWRHLQNSCSCAPAAVSGSHFSAPPSKLVGRRRPQEGHSSFCAALWWGEVRVSAGHGAVDFTLSSVRCP